jgi:hypothetical protein
VVKPNLAQNAEEDTKTLVRDLNSIAELAESFTKARTSPSAGDPTAFVDQLDLEGDNTLIGYNLTRNDAVCLS